MFEVKSLKSINDDLTGLLSKQAFLLRAQELINEDKGVDCNYAFIFFDLVNFKTYNVNYGFEKGDELLLYISQIIKLILCCMSIIPE